jgi:hypothetical protein
MGRVSNYTQGLIMRDLESKIVQVGLKLLNSHRERLGVSGITWRGPDIEVWKDEPERYTSELRITLLKDGEVNDVLEFHVYDNGQAMVTPSQAITWINEQLEALEKQQT